ncbi:MAG: hypothetical protein K0R29_2843 [Pseudobdellovibrio sp.]|jgi:hypothetical protein|nr:hypothetical protein [Pseudobdellovibrio sp.]
MKLVEVLAVVFLTTVALAHGEDKPGPNGGYIQMPGSFHTEVVPEKDGTFKVYLLTLQNDNPTIKNSSVAATIVNGKKKQKLDCMPMGEHFHCKTKSGLKAGTLVISANREGAVGVEAKYKLPLKLTNAKGSAPQSHDGHH